MISNPFRAPWLAALALPVVLGSAQAVTLAVINGNFTTGEAGWTFVESTGESDSSYVQDSGAAAYGNVAHFKDGIGTATDLYLQQNLTTANAGLSSTTYNNYTISFDMNWRADNNAGDGTFLISLINANGNATLASSTFTLATANVSGYPDMSTTAPGTTFLRSVNLSYNPTGVAAGDVILRIARTDADTTSGADNYLSTAWLDNVAVTAVPEPSAALLGLLGFAGLLRRRR